MSKLLGFRPVSVVMTFCFLVALASTAFAQRNVVATVGGIPITKYELARAVSDVMPLNLPFHGSITQEKINEVTEESLGELIEQAYKVRYALAEEISVDNSSVEAILKPSRDEFNSDKEFRAALGDEGLNGYRAAIYRKLLAEKAEDVAVESRVKVSEDDVRKHYEDNKATFLRPDQYRASHIFIKIDPSSNQEELAALKDRAEKLLERARSGEDFYDLAYYNSDDRTKYVGGDLGHFHKGRTVKEFEDAVVKLQVGEISDLVRSRAGFHIIKLTEFQGPTQLSYDEMKAKIREKLEKAQRDAYYEEWMSSLKSQYQVQRTGK